MRPLLGFLPLLIGSGPLVWAQSPKPQEPSVTFKSSVHEVALDMVIRDSHGRVVKNLKPEEVTVLENGVPQPITSFRLVSGHDIVMHHTETKPARGKTPAVRALHSPNSLPAVNFVCIVFHNVDPDTLKYAVDAISQFLEYDLEPGTGVAFFNLGSRLTLLHRFTTDRKELLKTLSNVFIQPLPDFVRVADAVVSAAPYQVVVSVSPTGETALVVTGGDINPGSINGADVGTFQNQQVMRGLSADQRRAFGHIEGMRQWDQMKLMLEELGPLPGRKSILLVSSGLVTTGDPDMFEKLLTKANQNQISVYALDVHGLTQNSNVQATNAALKHVAGLSARQTQIPRPGEQAGAIAMENARQGEYLNAAVRTSDPQASLRALAEGTGGFLIANTDDLRKPFQQMFEDVNTHYEASYRPSSSVFDGRRRNIEVKLARADLNVQSRTGYYALPAAGGSSELALYELVSLAALNAKVQPHFFDFQTAAYQFRSGPAGSERVLAFQAPASAFKATPLADTGRSRVHVSIFALIKDSTGQVVDRYSQDTSYEVPDKELEAMRKLALPFSHKMELPPGHYTVETAILDQESNRANVGASAFDVAEPKGLGLSSAVLVQQLAPVNGLGDSHDPFIFPVNKTQARRVIPELSGRLASGAQPLAYFVVYPDKSISEKPKLLVEYLSGGRVVAQQTAELPPPNASGAIPMVVKAAAHPGDCELRITALQGGETTTQDLKYSIDR